MDLNKQKDLLNKEKEALLADLGRLGDPGRGDQHVSPEAPAAQPGDVNEAADRFEEYRSNVAIEGTLEERLLNVEKALAAIEDGSYGTCNVGEAHPIPEGRLEANPAAHTCVEHAS